MYLYIKRVHINLFNLFIIQLLVLAVQTALIYEILLYYFPFNLECSFNHVKECLNLEIDIIINVQNITF